MIKFMVTQTLRDIVANAKDDIMFVKDDGCYIMAAGYRHPETDKPVVIYACGLHGGPDNYENVRAACGGDDFVEHLPASDFSAAIDAGAKEIFIKLTADTLEMGYLK